MLVLLSILLLLGAAPASEWRVVGGEPASEGDWPDAAAVYAQDGYLCTGTLIAPDVVLTAAHCDWNLSHVVVGTVDHAQGGEQIDIARSISHPQYWTTYDVAALILEREATVTPRPLATDCVVRDWLADGADVAVVGYGKTDPYATELGTELYEAFTTVVDHDCSEIALDCNPAVSPGGELIAGGDGVDSCNGDSGGPLYLLTDRGDFLAGVTSRATSDNVPPCGNGGIYVRPDAVIDWVEEQTGRDLPRPTCAPNRSPAPTVDPVVAPEGHRVQVAVDPNDPDPHDRHYLTVAAPPAHGEVQIRVDGSVLYTADWGADADRFTLEVTDDGSPPLSGQVQVDVDIVPVVLERGAWGCATPGGAAPAWPILLLLVATLRRRP